MGKKASAESQEVQLKKKVATKRASGNTPEGAAALRALRKRLKREQRKRRTLVARKKHAAGNAGAATAA